MPNSPQNRIDRAIEPRRGFLLVSLSSLLAGCSSLTPKFGPNKSIETAASEKSIHLSYRTDSGRLNRAAGAGSTVQTVAYQSPQRMPVPPFSESTLEIQYPHPGGVPGRALLRVTFAAPTEDSESPNWIAKVMGDDEEKPSTPSLGQSEIWEQDIPEAHLAAVMKELKKRKFFERIKVLGDDDAHIVTTINGNEFGKRFPAVAELDSIIINIRRTGRLVNGAATTAPMHTALRRLPRV